MKALIVSSYDKSIFPHLDSVRFFEYLINEVGMIKDDIVFYGRAEHEAGTKFSKVLQGITSISRYEPLIIYYAGHGLPRGWDFKKNAMILYSFVFQILKKRNWPLIFINDCCFGMVVVHFLKKIKCQKMLLGLAPRDRNGYINKKGNTFLRKIFDRWQKRLPANPRVCIGKKKRKRVSLKWGDNLDYIMYSRKKK